MSRRTPRRSRRTVANTSMIIGHWSLMVVWPLLWPLHSPTLLAPSTYHLDFGIGLFVWVPSRCQFISFIRALLGRSTLVLATLKYGFSMGGSGFAETTDYKLGIVATSSWWIRTTWPSTFGLTGRSWAMCWVSERKVVWLLCFYLLRYEIACDAWHMMHAGWCSFAVLWSCVLCVTVLFWLRYSVIKGSCGVCSCETYKLDQ